MRTNVAGLVTELTDKFKGGMYDQVELTITTNEKKAEYGDASITIKAVSEEKQRVFETTMYIYEKEKGALVVIINDVLRDQVFDSFSNGDTVEKAKKYLEKYVERSISKMLDIKIADGSQPKRPGKKPAQKKA